MIKTGGLVNNTRNSNTCFEAGFTVSDVSFKNHQIDRLVSANPTSNPTFGFLIDHALRLSEDLVEILLVLNFNHNQIRCPASRFSEKI